MKREQRVNVQPARRVRLIGTLMLAMALLAVFLWPKSDPEPPASKQERSAALASAGAISANPRRPPPDAPTETASAPPSPKPVIHAAYLDKAETCRGEQNFVNVDAHTENGTDAYLTILVTDPATGQLERGSRVAFRQQHASTEPIQIVVQGLGADQTLELPPATIKDCEEPLQVEIETARSFNAPDRVAFTAKIRESGGSSVGSFTPYEYVWDFDDGKRISETSGQVEHSYENRSQATRVSSFVVTVTARERSGRSASGSRTVTLSNFAFLAREFENKVDIQVGAKSSPEAGSAADRLWLYHGHDKPVRLTQVRMREVEAGASAVGREVERANFSPAQALGFSELRPHQSLDVVGLAKLAPMRPGTVRFYDVEGRSEDGKLAHATFVLSSPRPPSSHGTAAPGEPLDAVDEDTPSEPL